MMTSFRSHRPRPLSGTRKDHTAIETLSRRTAIRSLVAGSLAVGASAAAPGAYADGTNDEHEDSSTGAHFAAFIYAGTVDMLDEATLVTEIDQLELETHEREDDDDHEGNRDHDRDESWRLLGDGQDPPDELYTGDEDLDDTIDVESLMAEPHMVVVQKTGSQDSPVIAFGSIEGDLSADGTLLIQLDERDGSGYEGRAWFGPEPDDDDDEQDDMHELHVIVGLYPTGTVQPLGTPAPRG